MQHDRRQTLVDQNLEAMYKLYREVDANMEKFIKDNEAEIIRLCREKEDLGMMAEMKFTSPLRIWNYFVEENNDCDLKTNKHSVARTITITNIFFTDTEEKNMFDYQKIG